MGRTDDETILSGEKIETTSVEDSSSFDDPETCPSPSHGSSTQSSSPAWMRSVGRVLKLPWSFRCKMIAGGVLAVVMILAGALSSKRGSAGSSASSTVQSTGMNATSKPIDDLVLILEPTVRPSLQIGSNDPAPVGIPGENDVPTAAPLTASQKPTTQVIPSLRPTSNPPIIPSPLLIPSPEPTSQPPNSLFSFVAGSATFFVPTSTSTELPTFSPTELNEQTEEPTKDVLAPALPVTETPIVSGTTDGIDLSGPLQHEEEKEVQAPAQDTQSTTSTPTLNPSDPPKKPLSYIPGKLTHMEHGLLLSQGLRARVIAKSGEPVQYANGQNSSINFHGRPDAGATFAEIRPDNKGGFVYVSNSEMRPKDAPGGKYNGGVGAITFSASGEVLKYEMVLEGTTWNCGGGRTPWNTWVSCEEHSGGQLYQVSPFGLRAPEILDLGKEGGNFESFAYDVRDRTSPRFFVTEDNRRGPLQMWIPEVVDWSKPWEMLHGSGTVKFLELEPNEEMTGGTFRWTSNLNKGKDNAQKYYPNTEGIDCHGPHLNFVSKVFRQLYQLNLDDWTYTNSSTINGIFDGHPDQLKRVMTTHGMEKGEASSAKEILYFTEEGGKDAGVHGRNSKGEYFTILESPVYKEEVTGLAFDPSNRHMILAYQDDGILFDVYREDGQPFHAETLGIQYHGPGDDTHE